MKRKIAFFKSFEEMEEDEIIYYASLAPEQALMNLKKMCLAAYGFRDESEIPPMEMKIHFKENGD